MSQQTWSRRQFIEFLGRSSAAVGSSKAIFGATTLLGFAGCTHLKKPQIHTLQKLPFTPLKPTSADALSLAQGFQSQILIRWTDPINEKETFGFNNDYVAFVPLKGKSQEGILWVNHEYVSPLFVSGEGADTPRTKVGVDKEMAAVGGSLLHIHYTKKQWQLVKNSPYNRRITAHTSIPLTSPILGSDSAMGTLANCAGGITPWGHVLSCEENYHAFYGESLYDSKGQRQWQDSKRSLGWKEFYDNPPEHYGWVVEVNPLTGAAKKLIALGRFAHESATVIEDPSGVCVVYSGDDKANECIYKFIAAKPGSLEEGELFVADTKNGRWLSLDRNKNPKLKKHFKTQTEVLIRCREAAHMVGGTPQDRPEDIAIDPLTGDIFVALTGNKDHGNHHGSILKISEKDGNYLSAEFKASTFIAGGTESGFSMPDNLAFDKNGNLWMTSDISTRDLNTGKYKSFGNNGVFFIPTQGPLAGEVFQVAAGPTGSEITGPYFSPDWKTLFLAVQHPGEGTTDLKNPLSHWPDGPGHLPKPSVVTLSGPALDAIMG